MTDVFVNYRGADSNYAARLLFEGLKPRFGRQVFFDEETIQPGEDYVLRLLRGVRESTVLLAVIGPHWLAERRIDNPDDWIRRELVAAYQCGVRVIPVFTDGARPEDLEPLPSDIARLRTSQGMQLRRLHANEDIARISDEVARHVPARRRRTVAIVVALVALLLIGSGVGLSFLIRGDEREPAATSSTPVPTSAVETTTPTIPTTTRTTATTKPPEPTELWEGTVNLDFETNQVSFALDWAPPQRTLGGDIG
ncbi:MAG TPA: TIR domain-containing protein, partial [Lentzea sp.]